MRLHRRTIAAGAGARRLTFVLAAAVPLTPAGISRDLDAITNELSAASRDVDEAERALERALAPDGGRPPAARLADAELLLALGDHGRAALVLQGLVDTGLDAAGPDAGRARRALAESLFRCGDLGAARAAFSQVVAQRHRAYLPEAALRLIEIGDRRARWDGVDEALAALREGGSLPPEVAYSHARSLLRRGLATEAEAACGEVPRAHPLFAKARYLAAVAAVSRAELDVAAEVFSELTSLTGPYDDLAAVRELAAMDRGRLHLEQGRPDEAVLDYGLVPRDSPRFGEALYELAWVRVRRATEAAGDAERRREYRQAANALEVMLLADEGSSLLPEARLLLGNILLHLGSYEDAGAAFEDVVRQYGPLRDELVRLEAEARDPERHLEALAASRGARAALLPAAAARWATRREQLAVAATLLADLDATETSLAEAQAAASGLGAALAGPGTVPALRGLEHGQAALEARLSAVGLGLLAAERELVRGRLADAESDTLGHLLAERGRLAASYRAATAPADDPALDEAARRLAEIDRQAHQLRYPVLGLHDGLEVLRSWVVENAGRLAPDDGTALRQRIHLAELEAQALGREQAGLERALASERAALGVARSSGVDVRRRFVASLEREQRLLASARARAGASASPALAEIDRLRSVLETQVARLAALATRLEAESAARGGETRRLLATEVAELAARRVELEARRREARVLLAEVATLALAEARSRLEGVLLRADLGIVDVAWQLKERQGEVVDQRVGEERRDVSALDGAIKDVLGDE